MSPHEMQHCARHDMPEGHCEQQAEGPYCHSRPSQEQPAQAEEHLPAADTTQHNTTQHNAMQNTTQHNTTQCTTQHNTMHNTTQCTTQNNVQHNTTQHNAQHKTMHNTTQHNAQHNTGKNETRHACMHACSKHVTQTQQHRVSDSQESGPLGWPLRTCRQYQPFMTAQPHPQEHMCLFVCTHTHTHAGMSSLHDSFKSCQASPNPLLHSSIADLPRSSGQEKAVQLQKRVT